MLLIQLNMCMQTVRSTEISVTKAPAIDTVKYVHADCEIDRDFGDQGAMCACCHFADQKSNYTHKLCTKGVRLRCTDNQHPAGQDRKV